MDKIKLDVQEKGDLGIVAEASRSTQRTMFAPPKLTVQAVFSKLKDIAGMTGNSVSRQKYWHQVFMLSYTHLHVHVHEREHVGRVHWLTCVL